MNMMDRYIYQDTYRVREILEYVFADQVAQMDAAEKARIDQEEKEREDREQQALQLRADLKNIGVTSVINTWNLVSAGYKTIDDIKAATDEQLLDVKQVGAKMVEAIREKQNDSN